MPAILNPHTPGQFYLTQQRLPDPAHTNHLIFTVPAGYTYQILSMSCIFTTSSAAGNRFLSLALFDMTFATLARSTLPTAIPLSTAVSVFWGQGFTPRLPTQAIDPAELSWPVNLLVIGQNDISINIQGIKAGDQLSDIFLIAKQWFST